VNSVIANSDIVVVTKESGTKVIRLFLDATNVYSPCSTEKQWWYTINDNDVPFVSAQLVYNPHGHAGGLSLKDAEYYSQLSGNEAVDFLSNHSSWMIPHFDLHFYVWSQDVVNEINDPNTVPASSIYLPCNYTCPLSTFEPKMGIHCFNATKDYSTLEFSQSPDTIYGTYNGQVNFIETMFSNQFLKNVVRNENVQVDIPQPSNQVPFNPFPTKFKYRYNENRNAFVIVVVF
jgi:hypothetical protein